MVIIPDADEPGRRHAETVARSCANAGIKVRIVPLAAKDAAAFIEGGGTKADLVALVQTTPYYTSSSVTEEAPGAEPASSARPRRPDAALVFTDRDGRRLQAVVVSCGSRAALRRRRDARREQGARQSGLAPPGVRTRHGQDGTHLGRRGPAVGDPGGQAHGEQPALRHAEA